MNRPEALARLAGLALRAAVDVEDFSDASRARRRYRYANPDGPGVVTIEVDDEPGPGQESSSGRPRDKRACFSVMLAQISILAYTYRRSYVT